MGSKKRNNPRKCIMQKEMYLTDCEGCPYKNICLEGEYKFVPEKPCKECAGRHICQIKSVNITTCPYD